jgi:uncharacterized membrane protein
MSKFDSSVRARRLGDVAAAAVLSVATTAHAASSVHAASAVTDADALALAAKHCTACHSAEPTHPAFGRAPKGITLDTIEGLRSYRKSVAIQVVIERAMPLGNETNMTEAERARLGAWAEGRE